MAVIYETNLLAKAWLSQYWEIIKKMYTEEKYIKSFLL